MSTTGAASAALTPDLPAALRPSPPFPVILAQSSQSSFVAPGATLGLYRLWTIEGPLSVHVLALDLAVPSIHVGPVLASDRLISGGETVSSMARRTAAIGGINADYFDIGGTNQPLNVVVRNGMLLRTPNGRAALAIGADGSVRFGPFHFTGTARDGERAWTLGAVDEWPPQGTTATLVTPTFGSLPATPGATFVSLVPLSGNPAESYAGDYRVQSIDDLDVPLSPRFGLAYGPLAISATAIPDLGDTVRLAADTDPPLSGIASAVGGGPILIAGGRAAVDPNPPSPGEAGARAPQAGALRDGAGHLLFVTVDGRDPGASVGLDRPEFRSLLQALGAVDAIGFDGGGSATLVARAPGDAAAGVRNVPSDGGERPVADGLFAYSDAGGGPPDRLAIRPARLDLLTKAEVALEVRAVDHSGKPVSLPAGRPEVSVFPRGLATVQPSGALRALRPGNGTVHVTLGKLAADIPLQVLAEPAHLAIEPADANPAPGQIVALRAVARDAAGDPLALGESLQWSASSGEIGSDGRFRAGLADAIVTLRIGARSTQATVPVGRRTTPLDLFAGAPSRWTFATAPRGGPGELALGPDGLTLSYDFSGATRAAYANADISLAGRLLALAIDVRGDGNGAALRAAFRNAAGERVAVTLAKRIDWSGWRTCHADLPQGLDRLVSLYLVGGLGGPRVRATGAITLRDVRVTFAGTTRPVPAPVP